MSGFKTESLGKMTPEVSLAQAAELKWKSLMVVGMLEGDDNAVAFHACGASHVEFQYLCAVVAGYGRQNLEYHLSQGRAVKP